MKKKLFNQLKESVKEAMTDKTKELLPCPFCGSEAVTHHNPPVNFKPSSWKCECSKCGCSIPLWRETEYLAVNSWNRRV